MSPEDTRAFAEMYNAVNEMIVRLAASRRKPMRDLLFGALDHSDVLDYVRNLRPGLDARAGVVEAALSGALNAETRRAILRPHITDEDLAAWVRELPVQRYQQVFGPLPAPLRSPVTEELTVQPVLDHPHETDAGGNCRDPECGYNSDHHYDGVQGI